MTNDAGSSRIALAGILATAVVGLAAATLSWLVARQDRETQQTLAQATRVFDRQAKSYVDALSMMEPLDRQFGLWQLRLEPHKGRTKGYQRDLRAMDTAVDKLESSRIPVIAFGSPEARFQYAKAVEAAKDAEFWFVDFDYGAYADFIAEYKTRIRTFEGIIRRDLQ